MNVKTAIAAALASAIFASASVAQVPVVAAADQALFLQSEDPRLAQNKRLVYDFWREVLDAGHLDLADKYLAENYIQHNPNVPTGRAAFVEFFGKIKQPKPIEARITMPLVAIVAEGDLVILSFAREWPDPNDASKKYTTTWFDMFRIEHGKIVEHWDSALKQPARAG